MALSGSVSTTAYDGRYYKLSWSATQSVSDNTSTISWNLEALGGNSSWYAERSVTVKIAGVAVYSKTSRVERYKGTVKSGTTEIAHNSKGEASFSVSIEVAVYKETVNCKGSNTFTLDTIARASKPSCVTWPQTTKNVGDIGSTIRIHMNRASNTFTHIVTYKWGKKTGEIKKADGSAITDNVDWVIPENFADEIPNATSGIGTIYVDTYSGTTKIGSASVGFTATVPASYKPSISALTVAEAVSGLASKFGVYVQNQSKAKVAITAAGSHGSTIKLYTTTLTNGKTVLTHNGASFTSGLLSLSGTYTIKTVVTDSRGRTAEKSITISVVAYYPPEVNDFVVQRWDKTANAADDDGLYLHYSVKSKVAPVNNKNDKQIKFEYRISGASEWLTLTNWANMSAYSLTDYNTFTTPTFSTDNAYEIRVSVKDYFTSSTPATKKADLPTARTIFDILADGTGICFGGVASQSGVCQIDMQSHFTGGQKNLYAQEENNLNDFIIPNVYVSKNNAAETYANIPDGVTGTFTLEVMSAGQEGQLLQRLTTCSKDYPDIRARYYYGGTWGDWQRVGGVANIMTAHLSADTNTVANAYTKISLAQEYKIGAGLSISDGAITVGAGIKAVKVSANVVFAVKGAGGNKYIRIKKGTSDNYVAWAANTGTTGKFQLLTIPSKVINVTNGDVLSLYYHSADANDVISAGVSAGYYTFMTVEAVA
jgi:hypothetical protein